MSIDRAVKSLIEQAAEYKGGVPVQVDIVRGECAGHVLVYAHTSDNHALVSAFALADLAAFEFDRRRVAAFVLSSLKTRIN